MMNFRLAALVCFFPGILPALLADEPTQRTPTHADVSYGPDVRNVIDFWKADAAGARPIIVYIHGGAWWTGDKSKKGPEIQPFLDRGISFAAINYRLTPEHPLPAPVHDAARAIQFLRSKSLEWKIDERRIALTGPSAGACTSMWLLLHDDLADPDSTDPVLRLSTRVCAAAVSVGQTSIDPNVIEGWLGPKVLDHSMIHRAVGEKSIEDAMRNYDRHRDVYYEFSPINHVDGQDPPLFMTCSAEMDLPCRDAGHGIHHPVFGVKLKEKSDAVGHECHLIVPGFSSSEKYATGNDFLFDKLLSSDANP
jgi:acetyl esterase/lipase